ncbi:putative transcription factor bHLH041 isoform X1 [Pistacia vera]|uniref:putative transcription factor bHLH041 isoform X1 n=1 Tax=Pistacia vera TaxID=55513 RepID=UPI0012638050|nr:putative transcription factor bHLH041 isoform X1 [Pistacia vera]
MDTDFLLDDVARANFLRSVMQSFGCTYICLWSYYELPNCLIFWDGCYHEDNSQPSPSSGTISRRLFDEYRKSVIGVVEPEGAFLFHCSSRVPGLAFKNSQHYIELNESDLQRLASNDAQRLFYREARIKTAVFMACKSGEIELGLSSMTQINMETEMSNLFPKDLIPRQSAAQEIPGQVPDPNRPSSSSSSLRSVSMDSPEYSSLIFNIPTTSQIPDTLNEVPSLHPILPTTISPHHQAMQAFAQMRNIQLPTPESEHAAMTRAIFAVLTSPTSSSSSSQQHQHQNQPQRPNLPLNYRVNPQPSAFKKYNSALAPASQMVKRTQSMLKRAISYYRRLNNARREHALQNRPTNTQLHHMISERKRREKLNESFQALRSLLPPGTKKDKASLLIKTREYLSTLKDKVAELRERNQKLEAQIFPAPAPAAVAKEVGAEEARGSPNQRPQILVIPVPESTSEERIVDLRVSVTAECSMVDLIIRILELLKRVNDVSLVSMEASTRTAESSSSNHVIFRLRIQGNEWDESAFQEAVRRVVSEMAHSQ